MLLNFIFAVDFVSEISNKVKDAALSVFPEKQEAKSGSI